MNRLRRLLVATEVRVWLALLTLLAVTLCLAYVPLGWANPLIGFSIAMIKMLLVAAFFMHLLEASALIGIASLTGIGFFAILILLTFSDYLTRGS